MSEKLISGQAWNDINTLLMFLRGNTGSEAVDLYEDYYVRYNNSAPASLLREQIEIVQKHLDDSKPWA